MISLSVMLFQVSFCFWGGFCVCFGCVVGCLCVWFFGILLFKWICLIQVLVCHPLQLIILFPIYKQKNKRKHSHTQHNLTSNTVAFSILDFSCLSDPPTKSGLLNYLLTGISTVLKFSKLYSLLKLQEISSTYTSHTFVSLGVSDLVFIKELYLK